MFNKTDYTRHEFLSDYFFPNEEGYAVKKVNEKWTLVRQYTNGIWCVAIYRNESFEKSLKYYKEHNQKSML
jgi:hypothetical protein